MIRSGFTTPSEHHRQSQDAPEPLRPVFRGGLVIGVQVKRQPLVGVLEAGADAQNALFGCSLVVPVDLVIGELLKVLGWNERTEKMKLKNPI